MIEQSLAQSEKRRSHRAWDMARLGIGLTLLILLTQLMDWSEFWRLLRTINPFYVLIAFSLNILNLGLSAWRWRMLLYSDGASVSWRRLMRYYLIAQFFNNYLPPFVGADAVRMLAVNESKSSGRRVVPVLIERGTGLLALLTLGALSIFVTPRLRQYTALCVVVALAFLGTIGALVALLFPKLWLWIMPLLRRFPRLDAILRDIADTGRRYRRKRAVLAATISVSLLIQVSVVLAFYVRALAFNVDVGFEEMFLVAPVVTVLTLIPISPGGIGTQEGFTTLTFGVIGIGNSTALAMALLARALDLAVSVIGAGLWLKTPRRA